MPYKNAFTVRLDDDIYNKLCDLATTNRRSLNNQIEYIISQYLQQYEKDHGPIKPNS